MSSQRLLLLAALTVSGAVVSGLLMLEHHGVQSAVAAVSELCGDDTSSGCAAVSQSAYSRIGGVSLAALGAFFYLSLLFLLGLSAVSGPKVRDAAGVVILAAAATALLVDLVLLGIQAFSIGAFCSLCLVTYFVNGAIVVVAYPSRRVVSSFAEPMALPEGRIAFTGWVLGVVSLAAFTGAAEVGLGEQAAARQAQLLGAPGAAVAPVPDETPSEPAETAGTAETQTPDVQPPPAAAAQDAPAPSSNAAELQSLRAQLQQARQESSRLQGLLDDPGAYQQYQDDKAARTFEEATPEDLALDGTPFKGPAEAPVQVVEFSDFMCPFCRNLAGAFSNYLPTAGNRVSIFFKHYPLDQACNPGLGRNVHPGACELALGAICANQQGLFWEMHDQIFAQERHNATRQDVIRLGVSVGLIESELSSCMASSEARDRLDADISEAKRLGINSTPTLFINGKRLPRINDFLRAVNTEAERLGVPPGPSN